MTFVALAAAVRVEFNLSDSSNSIADIVLLAERELTIDADPEEGFISRLEIIYKFLFGNKLKRKVKHDR